MFFVSDRILFWSQADHRAGQTLMHVFNILFIIGSINVHVYALEAFYIISTINAYIFKNILYYKQNIVKQKSHRIYTNENVSFSSTLQSSRSWIVLACACTNKRMLEFLLSKYWLILCGEANRSRKCLSCLDSLWFPTPSFSKAPTLARFSREATMDTLEFILEWIATKQIE